MADNNETVAEIVAEMRKISFGEECCPDCGADFQRSNDWPIYARRIGAAHRRELTDAVKPVEANYECAIEQLVAKDKEIAELRECLLQASTDVCLRCVRNGRNFVCSKGFECEHVKRWRRALEGVRESEVRDERL